VESGDREMRDWPGTYTEFADKALSLKRLGPSFLRYQRYAKSEIAAGRRPLPEDKWRAERDADVRKVVTQ
jgi:hypothetical protein